MILLAAHVDVDDLSVCKSIGAVNHGLAYGGVWATTHVEVYGSHTVPDMHLLRCEHLAPRLDLLLVDRIIATITDRKTTNSNR
jgi:hypothetical protein